MRRSLLLRASGGILQMPVSAVATVPWCTPRSNMTCGFCHRLLWDCSCPRSVECTHCELNPEDADFVNADRCMESPDGQHDFVSKDKEP